MWLNKCIVDEYKDKAYIKCSLTCNKDKCSEFLGLCILLEMHSVFAFVK